MFQIDPLRRRLRREYASVTRSFIGEYPAAGTQWRCDPVRGLDYGVVSMGAGVADAQNSRPTLLTRACLVGAALLPWFSVFSGTYGLYFYVVLVAMLLSPWLLIPVLVLAAPFAVLLLLIMPAGAVYAAVRGSPQGWAGRLTRAGCLVSMGFAVAYGGLMMAVAVAPVFVDGVVEGWDFSLTWRVGILVVGLLATWRAWCWLRRWAGRT